MKVPDTKENLMKCICMNCPTHTQEMKDKMQGMFCARGKSGLKFERKGCLCGECPLASEYKLSGGYFCDMGAAE